MNHATKNAWPLLLLLLGGCGPVEIHTEDKAVLDALFPYRPTHKLDNQGRVIDLQLEGANVEESALDAVAKLKALRRLSLYDASIGDAAIAKLHANRQLEALGLGGTKVTDKGLAHLEKMPALSWLWLSKNAKVSEAGVSKLKRALPALTVYRQ